MDKSNRTPLMKSSKIICFTNLEENPNELTLNGKALFKLDINFEYLKTFLE